MVSRSVLAFTAALLTGSAFAASREENLADPIVGVEDAVLADAPNVPAPDPSRSCDQGHRPSGSPRAGGAARRRRALHLLDLRRTRARQVHPRPRGRRGRDPSRQPPRQQESAQHRPARGQRPGRRRGGFADRARPQLGLLVQGAEPRAVRLSLRDRAGRHAHRQRHVRHDPGRAEGGPAEGRPRVLRHAGRVLHSGRKRRTGPAAVQHGRRRSTRSRSTSCSTGRSARRSATRRSPPRSARRCGCSSATAGRTWSHRSTSSARSSTPSGRRATSARPRTTCRRR